MVNIAKGEHWTSQYRAINPLGKIPCYAEPGFSLGESASIMRYLASTNKIADHWYPSECGLLLHAFIVVHSPSVM